MPIDPISNLYFESYGEQNPRTIVFLHGGGLAGWMWREQVKALQGSFHCLVPDLPEQGQNVLTDKTPFSIETASDRIIAFIRNQAHDGKASVVGLSEGAQVAVAILARAPQVVERAFVSSAMLRPMWVSKMYTRGLLVGSHRWFVKPFRNNDWWINLNRYSNGIPDNYSADFKRTFQEITEEGFANMMVSSMNFRMPAGLEKANLPVLVVTGSKEYKGMKQSALDLLAVLPNARGVMVDLGKDGTLAKEHGWAITAPARFNAALLAFLNDEQLPEDLKPITV